MYFEDFIFVAKDIVIPEENRAALVFSPNNRVGEVSPTSFSFTTPVDLKPASFGFFDKVIIQANDDR